MVDLAENDDCGFVVYRSDFGEIRAFKDGSVVLTNENGRVWMTIKNTPPAKCELSEPECAILQRYSRR
jgi:hypothetical protein